MFRKYFKKIYKKRLKKLKEKFKKRLQIENDKYISVLNHDIKTALLAQIQALELYLDNKAPKEIICQTLNSSYFLYEIVQNAIFLSNFEHHHNTLKLENVEITDITNCIKKSIENFAKFKNQKIILKTNQRNITCKADRFLVNKIIHNLITSSISYGFENSNIEISIKETKKTISFSAKNKSVYMTKEKIKHILEDKKSNDFNQLGMSLNLNIANKLICAHHWDIVAKSDKNNSSVFGFVVKK